MATALLMETAATLETPVSRQRLQVVAAIAAASAICQHATATLLVPVGELRPERSRSLDPWEHHVALGGETAVVGSPGDDTDGFATGRAYVFDVNSGRLLQTLAPEHRASTQRFGFGVASDGQRAVVGTVDEGESDRVGNGGAAYLFDLAAGTQVARLTINDPPRPGFGRSVAISGGVVAVGSPGTGPIGLFEASSGEPITELTKPDGSLPSFGARLDSHENNLLVGDNRSNRLYLYDNRSGDVLLDMPHRDDSRLIGHTGRLYFRSVSIHGDRAVALRSGDQHRSVDALLFDLSTGRLVSRLEPINRESLSDRGLKGGYNSVTVTEDYVFPRCSGQLERRRSRFG